VEGNWRLGREDFEKTAWWCNVPILKNDGKVNGKDDIPYIMENNPNV